MKGKILLASLIPLAFATSSQAQTWRELSIAVGFSQYDASGTGTAPMGAARFAGNIAGNWLLADVSAMYASLDEQFSTASTNVGVFEGQAQLQLPLHAVQPYIGVGGGWLHYFSNAAGRPSTGRTVSGSVGLRIPMASRLLLRGEMRLRAWDSGDNGLHNSAAEFTAGAGYIF